jgi:hypothetical protein
MSFDRGQECGISLYRVIGQARSGVGCPSEHGRSGRVNALPRATVGRGRHEVFRPAWWLIHNHAGWLLSRADGGARPSTLTLTLSRRACFLVMRHNLPRFDLVITNGRDASSEERTLPPGIEEVEGYQDDEDEQNRDGRREDDGQRVAVALLTHAGHCIAISDGGKAVSIRKGIRVWRFS